LTGPRAQLIDRRAGVVKVTVRVPRAAELVGPLFARDLPDSGKPRGRYRMIDTLDFRAWHGGAKSCLLGLRPGEYRISLAAADTSGRRSAAGTAHIIIPGRGPGISTTTPGVSSPDYYGCKHGPNA
jgi:hypothetical protein